MRVNLGEDRIGFGPHVIYYVNAKDYPGIKLLRGGEEIEMEGRIGEIDYSEIHLNNATIRFSLQ